MAWHSKWANIKHRKWAQDAKRWKIFMKHAKLVAIAARWWSDPDMNPTLKTAIDNAKADNVPNDNIDRAVKKWSWEWKDATQYFEVVYEAYAPGWVAMIIEALTDNKNRTLTSVKTIVWKNWWNLAENGSVSWMFDKKWEIKINLDWKDLEEFEFFILESWAEDFEIDWEWKMAIIITWSSDLASVRDRISKAWYEVEWSSLAWIANKKMKVDDEKIEKINKLIELLEEDDDVNDIYTNLDF